MSDTSFLTAMRLADSFLPIGTYTASYGVEQYLNEGRIETAGELCALVEGYLRRIVGPADTVALATAHRGAEAGDLDAILAADERLHAATLPAEFRESASKAGDKLLALLAETDDGLFAAGSLDGTEGPDDGEAESIDGEAESIDGAAGSLDGAAERYAEAVDAGRTPGQYPVVLGVVTRAAGIERREACLVNAYAFVTELLGAAQRLGRFGHTAVQSQLADLLPVVESVCDEYADADLAALTSFAPLAETMGMAHERADRRLFMS